MTHVVVWEKRNLEVACVCFGLFVEKMKFFTPPPNDFKSASEAVPKRLPVHKMIPPATATKQTEGCATPQANIELHQLWQIRHLTQAKQCNISGFILPFLFERVIVVINASSLVNHNSEVPLSIFCRFLSRAAVKAKRTEFKKFRRRCNWCGLRR